MARTESNKNELSYWGGRPIRSKPMPGRKLFDKVEIQAVLELFDYYDSQNTDFGYQGEFERRYTNAFIKYMGENGYADAVCSGTAALFVAIASLQLKKGDHVLVSPVTDPGTISAIILNGLVPVLMDSEPGSFNIGLNELRERITDKAKAVVIVHVGGTPVQIDKISFFAKEKGLYVIEDCSQAHGAMLNGRKVGAFGDIACFSTMYKKNHATGGCGGVIFTRNEAFYNFCRAYADRGKPFFKRDFNDKDPSVFLFPALNLNIDEISCAVGITTLAKLDNTIRCRVDFLQDLGRLLSQKSKVCYLSGVFSGISPFFQTIIVDTSKITCSKKEFAEAVKAEGIDVNVDYRYVVAEWEWVKEYVFDNFNSPNAVNFRNRSFNLLFNEKYGEQELEDIVAAIVKVERAYLKQI